MAGPDRRYTRKLRTTENVLELLHFEDLPLGGEWTTRRRTITQADLTAFVNLSGDLNPLYADAEHARSGPFGGVVVPGGLIAAVVTGLGAIDVPVPATVGLVGMSWRFLRPVHPGDTIASKWRLNRKRKVDNVRWGLAVWQIEVENQRGEVVATGEMDRLVARREQPADRQGRGRRRKRRSSGEQQAAADGMQKVEPAVQPVAAFADSEVEAPLPRPAEPAPDAAADVQPETSPAQPAGTRRRRRQAPKPDGAHEEAPSGEPPEKATADQEVARPASRRRRRRGGEAQGAAEPPAHVAVTAEPARAEQLPEPAWPAPPQEEREPAPSTAPEARTEDDDSTGDPPSGGLASVLRLLRGRT